MRLASDSWLRSPRYYLQSAVLAAGYAAAGWVCMQLPLFNGEISLLWIPSGIGLAAIYIMGMRFWPALLVGSIVTAGAVSPGILALAAGNTLSSLAGAWWLRRTPFRQDFARLEDVKWFLAFGVVLSPTIAAFVGPFALWTEGLWSFDRLPGAMLRWWMGDALGALAFAPPLLALAAATRRRLPLVQKLEGLLLCLALITIGLLVFDDIGPLRYSKYPLAYLPFPLLIWATLRFGLAGAMGAVLLVAGFATDGVIRDVGLFSQYGPGAAPLLLWTYIASASLTVLLLAAMLAERRNAERRLSQHRGELDRILQSASDAIVSYDGDDRIRFFNHAAERMFGVDGDEAVGRPLRRFFPEGIEHPPAEALSGRSPDTTSLMPLNLVLGRTAAGHRLLLEARRLHPLQPGAMRGDGAAGLKKRIAGCTQTGRPAATSM